MYFIMDRHNNNKYNNFDLNKARLFMQVSSIYASFYVKLITGINKMDNSTI